MRVLIQFDVAQSPEILRTARIVSADVIDDAVVLRAYDAGTAVPAEDGQHAPSMPPLVLVPRPTPTAMDAALVAALSAPTAEEPPAPDEPEHVEIVGRFDGPGGEQYFRLRDPVTQEVRDFDSAHAPGTMTLREAWKAAAPSDAPASA